jgi:hypothetical protein
MTQAPQTEAFLQEIQKVLFAALFMEKAWKEKEE